MIEAQPEYFKYNDHYMGYKRSTRTYEACDLSYKLDKSNCHVFPYLAN